MLTLDLFNNDHERRLAEGAVDKLEQRRIDDLAMRMDDLVSRARKADTPKARAALVKEFQRCKDERDSYFKIKEADYTGLGETGLPDVADKAAKMARLNQPGRAGTDVVTPQQRVNPNPNKGIIGHAADWLRGKGGPGKEGPTYEEELDEGFGPVGSKALMNGNFATFMKARSARQPVTLEIGGEQFRLTPAMMDAMAKKYSDDKHSSDADPKNRETKLIAINNYRAFGYPDLMKKFIAAVATPEPTPAAGEPGEQLPMFEKKQSFQKKNSKKTDPDLDSGTASDTTVQRELQKVRARHPAARSDIEALVKDEIVNQERVNQQLSQQQATNQQQDSKLSSLQQQLATAVQSIKSVPTTVTKPAITPTGKPTAGVPLKAPAPTPISVTTNLPAPTTPHDQKIYDKVQSLEQELKDKIDAMASWNAIAQKDPQSQNELEDLRKEVERTRKELQKQVNTLKKGAKPMQYKPVAKQVKQAQALPDPNVIDVDAWEIPGMEIPNDLELEPASNIALNEIPAANDAQRVTQRQAEESVEKPTGIGQMAKNIGQGQKLQQDPAYRSQVRRTQQQVAQRQQNIARQQAGYDNDPDEFDDIPNINESSMSELDAMRQDLELMSDIQFLRAYGISKVAFEQKYRTLLKPAQQQEVPNTLHESQRLHAGDPIVVTASNEFEGKTGDIVQFSPSGKFVVVNLYNHGRHSMHLSDVAYNDYADQEDDWYDDADEFGKPGSEFFPEGFQDFTKKEPYEVCLAGKCVKTFDRYADARRFHDNWKAKLYREGNKVKADSITLNPVMKEAISRRDLLKQIGDKLNDPEFRKTPAADPAKRWERGDLYTGPGPDDPYYTKNFGHGYPDVGSNRSHNRDVEKSLKKKKGVAEAGSPAQQAAIAIAMKKAGKKPKHVDENTAFLTRSPRRGPQLSYGDQAQHTTLGPVQVERHMPDGSVVVHCERDGKKYRTQPSALKLSVAEDTGSWIVYDPETRQIKKRFKTHTASKSYARTHGLRFASSEYYFDNIKDQKAIAETVTDVKAEMARVYRKLAPKIERYKDSFLAGQLYDELENIAELHGAEGEFKRMMAGARNRAHMDYDTNPGGFQNWFWYLPFEDETIKEENSTDSEAVEIALIRRILVAHTDLIMQFGLDKVTEAIEEVAYNVGDIDEIGSSDVSGWIHQVKQILGAE